MRNDRTILDPESLSPNIEQALLVLGTPTATNEAVQKALHTVRKAIINSRPTVSAGEIVYAASELSKSVGKGGQQAVASMRMRHHLKDRGEK